MGVTVTLVSILSELCVKLTIKLAVKKLVPANVKVLAAPLYIFPVTLVKVGIAAAIFIQFVPSEK